MLFLTTCNLKKKHVLPFTDCVLTSESDFHLYRLIFTGLIMNKNIAKIVRIASSFFKLMSGTF